MKAYYQIIISDKNGKVIKKFRKRISKSYVLQWLQILNASLRRAYAIARYPIANVRDTSNTLRTFYASTTYISATPAIDCPTNDDTYGLLVGKSSEAIANTNYKMYDQILHGNTAGKLMHGSHSWVDAQIVGANVDFIILRSFSNISGNTITITEIGIYVKMEGSAANQYFLILRDLPTPVELENGKTITVIYTLRTTA